MRLLDRAHRISALSHDRATLSGYPAAGRRDRASSPGAPLRLHADLPLGGPSRRRLLNDLAARMQARRR